MSKIRSPTLRFREFEDDWTYKCLSEFAYRVTKKNTNLVERQVLSNSAKFGVISQDDFFDKEIAKPDNLAGYLTVDVDDFIYNPRVSVYAKFGPVKRNKLGIGVVSPLYTVFRINEGNLDFFEQYFNSTKWHRYIYKIANCGARAGRMSFKGGDYFNLPVPNIGEIEQQKIADFLSSVDTRIEQLEKKRSLLEQYKKGLIQKLFSQEIRFKNDQDDEYFEWKSEKFSTIANRVSESFRPDNDEPVVCIELENLVSESGTLNRMTTTTEHKSTKIKFQAGDVLFGKLRPYLKKFFLSEFSGVCTTEIWVLRPTLVDSKFLFYLIQSSQFTRAANYQFGSKMPRSDWRIVSQTRIPIPTCRLEQKKIADFLCSIDKKIELLNEQIDKTREFKLSLLQQMFV